MRTFHVTVNGETYEVAVEELGANANTGAAEAPARPSYDGGHHRPHRPAPVAPAASAAPATPAAQVAPAAPAATVSGGTSVTAPMPGTILKVNVAVGDMIKKGSVLCILEAMKMENEILAPQDAKVLAVPVQAGASVNPGDLLVALG